MVNFLSFMMQHLAENPADCTKLVDYPDLIDNAVEELLHRYGLVTDARIVNGDNEMEGATLLDGDMIAVPTMLFDLDPQVAMCPMNVDLNRKDPENFTFGHGVHRCTGSHLARYEIGTTPKERLACIPEFEVVPNEKIRHQSGIVGAVVGAPLQWWLTRSFQERCRTHEGLAVHGDRRTARIGGVQRSATRPRRHCH